MKLAGEYSFEASIQEVWDALFDPQVLAAVMPGCEKLELVDGSYLGDINVKVGPIQGKFSGKVDLSDMVEPKSYKMVVDGKGSTGFVKATASIDLESVGTGTKVKYDADAQVGGKIASVGQRLIETSAKAIVKQSLEGLAENIKIRSEAYRKLAAENAKPSETPLAETTEFSVDKNLPASDIKPTGAPVTAPPLAVVRPDPVPAATPADVPAAALPPVTAKPVPAEAVKHQPPVEVKKATPVIEYKKADAGKIAGAVAKEVTKTLAPVLLVVAIAIALVIYFVAR